MEFAKYLDETSLFEDVYSIWHTQSGATLETMTSLNENGKDNGKGCYFICPLFFSLMNTQIYPMLTLFDCFNGIFKHKCWYFTQIYLLGSFAD